VVIDIDWNGSSDGLDIETPRATTRVRPRPARRQHDEALK
jgi:hypothetical protein